MKKLVLFSLENDIQYVMRHQSPSDNTSLGTKFNFYEMHCETYKTVLYFDVLKNGFSWLSSLDRT